MPTTTFPRRQRRIRGVFDGIRYPDPLTLSNGRSVTDVRTWEEVRRPELIELFEQHIFGRTLPAPISQGFRVDEVDLPSLRRKIVEITVTGPHGSASFPLRVFTPKAVTQPHGLFLFIDHRDVSTDDPRQSSGYLPLAELNEAGYAVAVFHVEDVAPDDPQRFRHGLLDLFHEPSKRLPSGAGRAISAWAWAASRALDYLQTDPEIDPENIAIIGHSRGGKAALWAGAQDTRFSTVIANSSGCTGAKMARRLRGAYGAGEDVATINDRFPHWFAETYRAYNGNEMSLPVDQHELLALIAPRNLYIGSSVLDANADPKGELLGLIGATSTFELYGLENPELANADWPPNPNTPFFGEGLGYHLRSGDHDLSTSDWTVYVAGMDRQSARAASRQGHGVQSEAG